MKESVFNQAVAVSIVLLAVSAIGIAAGYPHAPFFALLGIAAFLLLRLRSFAGFVLALLCIAGAFGWSTRLPCSAYSKAQFVLNRLAGDHKQFPWSAVLSNVASPCFPPTFDAPRLETKQVNGREWVRYQTELGPLWIADRDSSIITYMVWELLHQDTYQGRDVRIEPGDHVLDVGGHIGIFTRFALAQGAAKVLAIEPDPVNRACFEENLAAEIADGRVIVAPAGAWDSRTTLPLYQHESNSGASSFVRPREDAVAIDGVPLLPIDDILEEHGFDRVDFIKMDIEGAERNAIRGAYKTLERFHPPLAICVYHRGDDMAAVPESVNGGPVDYAFHARTAELLLEAATTKVLLFSPQ